MSNNFTSPTGRLVFGDAFKPSPVLDDNKKQKVDPVTGALLVEYVVGVAFNKQDPAWHAFKAELRQADRAAWPNFFQPNGELVPGVQFFDKIVDGDGRNKKGELRSSREGFAGHEVVTFASRFAPTCHAFENGRWVQITDPNAIKRGYYIRVDGTTATNNSQQSPGMYRNLSMIALIGYGQEIVGGPDANERFGNAPPPLPPGASMTPVAPAAPMPAAPAAPYVPPVGGAAFAPVTPPPYTPPSAPAAPPTSTTPYPTNPPAPAYAGYMQPPPAPAAPIARVMLPSATATYEQYIASGWNDDQLRQHGLMA